MPRRVILICVLAGCSALSASSPAAAVIVPQQGMAGVRLGMTEAQVRGVLGRPTSATNPPAEILGTFRLLRYGPLSVFLFSGGGRVFTVSTTGTSQRTARGIGVGSAEASVQRLVTGSRCRTEFGRRHCYVGAFLPGRVVTDFSISRRGHVYRVLIGRVID